MAKQAMKKAVTLHKALKTPQHMLKKTENLRKPTLKKQIELAKISKEMREK